MSRALSLAAAAMWLSCASVPDATAPFAGAERDVAIAALADCRGQLDASAAHRFDLADTTFIRPERLRELRFGAPLRACTDDARLHCFNVPPELVATFVDRNQAPASVPPLPFARLVDDARNRDLVRISRPAIARDGRMAIVAIEEQHVVGRGPSGYIAVLRRTAGGRWRVVSHAHPWVSLGGV